MRRLALLVTGCALWLFLAAVPALADGGPHVGALNNGSMGLTADSCAGCHRAHTAQGPYLLNSPDEEALCLTCHGAAGTGSTVDVMTGVQYAMDVDGLRDAAITLGATRNGGFDQARIGDPMRLSYLRNATAVSQKPKVSVGAAEDVTSAHLALPENGLVNPGIAWGNGANGTGAGAAVSLTCASCHNPHGNGQYRILNPVPHAAGAGFSDVWEAEIRMSDAATERVHTVSSNALVPGDVVLISGHSDASVNGTWTVATSTTSNNNVYVTLVGLDVVTGGTGGTMERISGATVTDAALPPADDTRNYTVLQVKGTEGTDSTYMLYASDVEAAAASGTFNGIPGDYSALGGDYLHRNVPWNPSINSPACDPAVYPADASCATADDAPNGLPSTFNAQITAWCSACHTRYFADQNPVTDPPDGTTGPAYANPRPGDDLYKYQHRTRANRACTTCHVSHGSNKVMDGTFSSTYTYPDGTVSDSSRLLKIDNRGTCQACHDPTGLTVAGTYIGPAGPTVP